MHIIRVIKNYLTQKENSPPVQKNAIYSQMKLTLILFEVRRK